MSTEGGEATHPDRVLLDAPRDPFGDAVARLDPSVPAPPHVDAVHAAVRAELRRAVAEVGASGRAAMVLVHGEPGQGKTHELARLRADAQSFFFVEIAPLKDAGAPFRHVQRHLVQGLLAQRLLDRFLWEALRSVTAALLEAARAADDGDVIDHLSALVAGGGRFVATFQALARGDRVLVDLLARRARRLPPLCDLDPELARVLCRLPDPDAEVAALDWLRGAELPDEDLALLGVTRSIDSESRAFDVLRSLVRVAPRPLALCFDQLESTSGLLGTVGTVVLWSALMELYQQMPVCLVLMCQSQVWAELQGAVPQAALERVRVLPMLGRPSPDDAVRLVAARLEPLWMAADVMPPYATYPFPPAYLAHFVREIAPSLRQVLLHCSQRYAEMRARGVVEEPQPPGDAADEANAVAAVAPAEAAAPAASVAPAAPLFAGATVAPGVAAVTQPPLDAPPSNAEVAPPPPSVTTANAPEPRDAIPEPLPVDVSRFVAGEAAPLDVAPLLAVELARRFAAATEREDLATPALRQDRLRGALLLLLDAAGRHGARIGPASVVGLDAPPRPASGPRPPFTITLSVDDDALRSRPPRTPRIALDVHSDDARGAVRALERLEKRLDHDDADHAWLLREAEALVGPHARRTLELAESLAPRGGILYVERVIVERVIAADLLVDAVAAGEVAVGRRAVTRDEAIAFLVSEPRLGEALGSLLLRLAPSPPARAAAPHRGTSSATRLRSVPLAASVGDRVLDLLARTASAMPLERLAASLELDAPTVAAAVGELERAREVHVALDRSGASTVVLARPLDATR